MKVSKESLKFVFKRKETYISFSILVLLIIIFCLTYVKSFNNFKGIRDFNKSVDIEEIYNNNSSIIYAIGEDNNLYYSFNKKYQGHLNTMTGIESLDDEYADATMHYYNFIKIDYQFPHKIINVDGFRDDIFGNNGYTLVLDEIGDLYVLFDGVNKPTIIERNVKYFDVGYFNFSVVYYNNQISEFIKKGNVFYRYQTNILDNVKSISAQGYKKINDSQKYLIKSYYLNDKNQFFQMDLQIDYEGILNYTIENTDNNLLKNIKNLDFEITEIDVNLYDNEQIKQILSIENSTIVLTDKNLYGIGDNYYDVYKGIFATSEEIEEALFYKIMTNLENIEYIYTSGPFALIIKCEDGFYYTGNLNGKNQTGVTKVNMFGKIEKIVANYSSVIVIKNKVIYRVGESGNLENIYNHDLIIKLIRYLSVFFLVADLFYMLLLFCEETKKYNRYKNIEVKL